MQLQKQRDDKSFSTAATYAIIIDQKKFLYVLEKNLISSYSSHTDTQQY